ncbi:MAG: ABC transporter ATP-binding protein [Pikeienuella sp.]
MWTVAEGPADAAAPDVEIAGRVRFSDGRALDIPALNLAPGGWTGLLGPSGAGKSTLLRLVAGLEIGGQFDGRCAAADGTPPTARASYMAQDDLLAPWLSVRGNLALGARLRGEPVDATRIGAMLGRIGLADDAEKHPPALSGGMRQRVALARALLEDRPIALLDEPFSALDARNRAEMQELAFATLTGRTVLFVTHDPAEAARLADRLYLVSAGTVRPLPAPPGRPIRDPGARATLDTQAALLETLRQAA